VLASSRNSTGEGGRGVVEQPIVLKVLLRKRHLQGHSAFKKEYDKLAKEIDKDLVGTWPSKAQFYRWLSGELRGLPYAHHCRILEAMFPGRTAAQLFERHDGEEIDSVPVASTTTTPRAAIPAQTADLTAVFPSRPAFQHEMPPHVLFDDAEKISMVGLSLNLLCQSYPDKSLLDLLESGTIVECLFLDPAGRHIKEREQEESHPAGVLSTLTTLNIQTLQRLHGKLTPEARGNLRIHTYDECVRFNITVIDDKTCIVQPYLPDARGVESPTLVAQKQDGVPGLFDTFSQVFESMWARSKEIAA
jgi:hypothetical protein